MRMISDSQVAPPPLAHEPAAEHRRAVACEADDYEAATIFGLVLVLLMSGIYALARVGFGIDLPAVATVTGAALLLVALPGLPLPAIARGSSPGAAREPALHGWLTLAALGVLIGGGLVARWTGTTAASFVIAAAGALCAAVVLVRWLSRRRPGTALIFTALSALLGAWAAGVVWAGDYMHPLAVERLLAFGSMHVDTLFQATIANMWETYGVPATGVDGVLYLAYHHGSHWFIAQLGNLAGVDPLVAYQLAYPVVVVPWLLVALLRFSLDARPLLVEPARWRPMHRSPLFWLILAAAMIGFLPAHWLQTLGSSYRPVLSQSYVMGIAGALLTGSLLIWLWRYDTAAEVGRQRGAGGAARSVGSWLALGVVLPLLTISLGFLKISLLAIMVGVQLYLTWRLKLYRSARYLVAMGIVLLGFLVTYRLTSPAQSSSWGGIHSLEEQALTLLWMLTNFYIPVHLFWTLLYLVLRLQRAGVGRGASLRALLRERRILDVEVVVLVALLGLAPGILLETGRNGYYFSDVQRWLAVGLLLGSVGLATQPWSWRRLRSAARHPLLLAAGVLALSGGTAMMMNVLLPGARLIRTDLEVRRAFAAPPEAAAAPGDPMLEFLLSLQTLPRAERAAMLMYVPRSVRAYWDRPELECWAVPFVAPAASGIALLDGLPSAPCAEPTFGYSSYPALNRPLDLPDLTPAEICARAGAEGVQRVLMVEGVEGGRVASRELRCPPAG